MDRWLAWAEGKLKEFDRPDFLPVLDWLKAHSRQVKTERLSVTHGDFHPWNILLCDDGRAFVIDWTQAGISDYRLDLAWTLVLIRATLGLTTRDAVLAGYEALAGHSVRDVGFFETASAFKRLVSIAVSITGGPERLGMRPSAAAAMRDQVEHLSTAYEIVREQTGLTLPTVEALL